MRWIAAYFTKLGVSVDFAVLNHNGVAGAAPFLFSAHPRHILAAEGPETGLGDPLLVEGTGLVGIAGNAHPSPNMLARPDIVTHAHNEFDAVTALCLAQRGLQQLPATSAV